MGCSFDIVHQNASVSVSPEFRPALALADQQPLAIVLVARCSVFKAHIAVHALLSEDYTTLQQT